MRVQLLSVLVLGLIRFGDLEEVSDHEYSVISTSQRPSQNQLVDERLTKLEERLEFHTRLAETNRRLEALELQNKRIQALLENVQFPSKNCSKEHIDISGISHQLEIIALQNQQMQMRLQNIESALSAVPNNSQSTHSKRALPRHCQEIKESGENVSNIYRIQPKHSAEAFLVFCDMETKGGGWTTVMNRFDGSQNFYFNWTDYRNGFGNLSGEFWLGLEHLHHLTDDGDMELLVELVNRGYLKVYARYKKFIIGNEMEGYFLKNVDGYSGDAGDSFIKHIGVKFSTEDRDHDAHISNCAALFDAGWWYVECFQCQFTGVYESANNTGIYWNNWQFRQVKMMVRPVEEGSPGVY